MRALGSAILAWSRQIIERLNGRFIEAEHDLEAIRADYENPDLTVAEVAEKHGTSESTIVRLARKHGWRQRQPRRIDRHDMIERLFRVLDRKVSELENSVTEGDTDQAAVLGRLVTTLDKLIAIKDAQAAKSSPRRSSKAMTALREQIADRIAQFAQP